MLLNRVMRPEAERVPAEAEAAEQTLQKPLKVLDGALSDRSYLLGDTFSIADLNVASVLSVVAFVRLDVSGFPNLARWLGACTSRPAFKRAQG